VIIHTKYNEGRLNNSTAHGHLPLAAFSSLTTVALLSCAAGSFAHVNASQALEFYAALLARAKARDGLVGWEVDFLVDQYHRFGGFRRDVSTADEYFGAMARAAEEQEVGLQHCMSIPRFALASLAYPWVTNARASDDYATASPLEYNQGNLFPFGNTAVLYEALDLAPSKDGFWSTGPTQGEYTPPAKAGKLPRHHNSELHALVATLSLGPVGFMDRLNLSAAGTPSLGEYVNVSLLRRTCSAGGELLQPARPVTITDATLRRGSTPDDTAIPARGHVWATHTELPLSGGGVARHYMVLPMVLASPFVLRFDDLYPSVPANTTAGWLRRSGRHGGAFCVNGAPALDSGCVTKAFDDVGVELHTGDWSGHGPYPWDLVLLSPALVHGWHFLGGKSYDFP
jgi:hypothetical protein